jgi:hypothetical protein
MDEHTKARVTEPCHAAIAGRGGEFLVFMSADVLHANISFCLKRFVADSIAQRTAVCQDTRRLTVTIPNCISFFLHGATRAIPSPAMTDQSGVNYRAKPGTSRKTEKRKQKNSCVSQGRSSTKLDITKKILYNIDNKI